MHKKMYLKETGDILQIQEKQLLRWKDGLIKIEFGQRIVSLHIPHLSVPFWPFQWFFSASAGLKAQFLSHSSHHLLSEFRGAGIRGNKRLKGRGGNAGLNYSFKILWLESSSLEIVIEMSSSRTGLKTTWSLLWTYCVLFFSFFFSDATL